MKSRYCLLFLCFIAAALIPAQGTAYQANIIKPMTKKFAPDQYKPKPYAAPEKYWDQTSANVEMYSQTFCGPCKIKRRQLKAAKIPFLEYFIDKDSAKRAEMYKLLDENKMPKSYYGTPMIVVNGAIMGNPSIDQIKSKLKR